MRRKLNWVLFCFLALALTASMVFTGCKEDLSSAKDITSFQIYDGTGKIVPNVDVAIYDSEIQITVGARTIINNVYPRITISEAAKIVPASGQAVNLDPIVAAVSKLNAGPVRQYVVTAEDDSTKAYYINVRRAPTAEMSIDLVPDSRDKETITIYGLQKIEDLMGNLIDPEIPLAALDWIKDVDIILSRQLLDANGDRFNPDLPDTMLISMGAAYHSNMLQDYIYDSIKWYVDQRAYTSGVGVGALPDTLSRDWDDKNIVRLEAYNYPFFKKHWITVVARKDGVDYSTTLTFVVVR